MLIWQVSVDKLSLKQSWCNSSFYQTTQSSCKKTDFLTLYTCLKKLQQVATFLFFLKITLIECGSTFTFITSLLLVFDVYLCSMLKTKLSTQNAKNEILNERIFFLKYLEIFKKKFLKSMVYIHITKITTKIIDCFKLCTFVLG